MQHRPEARSFLGSHSHALYRSRGQHTRHATKSTEDNCCTVCSGDHTVKLISCRTGRCLKVLMGHRRTPWVVRFHPTSPRLLASGSLDYEVRQFAPTRPRKCPLLRAWWWLKMVCKRASMSHGDCIKRACLHPGLVYGLACNR